MSNSKMKESMDLLFARLEKAHEAEEEQVTFPLIPWSDGLQFTGILMCKKENVHIDKSLPVCDVLEILGEDRILYWTPSAVLLNMFNDGELEENGMYRITCIGRKEGSKGTDYNRFSVSRLNV